MRLKIRADFTWKEYLKYDHTSARAHAHTHTHKHTNVTLVYILSSGDKILFLIIHMWMSFTLKFEQTKVR